MRAAVDVVLERQGGVITRGQLLQILRRGQLDDEIRRRHLLAVSPRVYCRPWDCEQLDIAERAAVISVGSPVALSHLSALRRCAFAPPDLAPDVIDLSVPELRSVRRRRGVRVHRVRRPPWQRMVDGCRWCHRFRHSSHPGRYCRVTTAVPW